jgi:fatty acid desaturase
MQVQFAFIGHDASHGSAAARRGANRLAGALAMGIVGGLCFEEWRGRHLSHHKHCQDEGKDPDMQFGTMFSLSAESIAQKGSVGRRIAPYQAYYFWPTTLLFAYSLRVLAVLACLREPRKYGSDLLSFAGHIAIWLVLPIAAFGFDPLRVVVVYLATSSLLGIRLGAVFAVNHVGMPAAAAGASHFEHQVVTSRNVRNPVWLDWFFGGLNYQIEHHILPACPRSRLRRVRAVVRPAVLEAGLTHHETNWGQAVAEVTRHLFRVSREAPMSEQQAHEAAKLPS